MRKYTLETLRRHAAHRPPGYYEEVIASGRLDGETLHLSQAEFERLREKYSNGLGDKVERALKPIVKLIDGVLGTHLATCKACARRKKWLNRL